MKSKYYDLNRLVHLARRDVFMEKAFEVFHKYFNESLRSRRVQLIESTVYYLESALGHAIRAAKSMTAVPEEKSLVLVIRTLLYYMHAVTAVTENETQLKHKESPLRMFLHGHGKSHAVKDVGMINNQLLENVSHFFHISEIPYKRLQQEIMDRLAASEKVQYEKACRSLKAHIATKSHQRHVLRNARIVYPALFAKYK